ncbi:MAG: hypothetical protein IJ409_01740 [Lachnospiraceae bacterium]|nr:hypothetical protein [Lachnospiraceae bacterium]
MEIILWALSIIEACIIGFGIAFRRVSKGIEKSTSYGDNTDQYVNFTTKPLKIYEKRDLVKRQEIEAVLNK